LSRHVSYYFHCSRLSPFTFHLFFLSRLCDCGWYVCDRFLGMHNVMWVVDYLLKGFISMLIQIVIGLWWKLIRLGRLLSNLKKYTDADVKCDHILTFHFSICFALIANLMNSVDEIWSKYFFWSFEVKILIIYKIFQKSLVTFVF